MVVMEVRPAIGGLVFMDDDACSGKSDEEQIRRDEVVANAILRIYERAAQLESVSTA